MYFQLSDQNFYLRSEVHIMWDKCPVLELQASDGSKFLLSKLQLNSHLALYTHGLKTFLTIPTMAKKARAIHSHLWFGILFLYKSGIIFKDFKVLQIMSG